MQSSTHTGMTSIASVALVLGGCSSEQADQLQQPELLELVRHFPLKRMVHVTLPDATRSSKPLRRALLAMGCTVTMHIRAQ